MGPIDVDFVGSDENDCATYAGPVDVDDTDSISSGSSAASSAKESVTSSTIDLASVISGDRSEDQTTRSSSTKASLIVARKNSTEIEVKDAHDTSEMEECLKLIDEVVDSLHSRNQVAAPDTSFIHVGPVDIDDFIPEDSYWSYFHEIVLDESSYCRGLAGYEEGFEPETITDLSQIKDWGDQVGDDDDELDESAIKDYTKPSTSAATANSKSAASPRQRRQLRYQSYPSSLPHTAAEV